MGMEGFRENPTLIEKEHITNESFEEQFNKEQVLSIEGVDDIPYTIVVPENLISEDWVVYVGGFGQGKESYLDEIQNLAQSGRKVLFTNPTKGITRNEDLIPENINDLPKTITAKSEAVQKILERVGADNVDLVGHSQGAAVVAAYAAEHPNIAKRIVLECPAGSLEGDDSRERIMGRFVADKVAALATDTGKIAGKSGRRAGKSFSKEVFGDYKNIGFRLREEIPGVAAVDIAPLLKDIKQRNEGTEIVLVNANKDKVYSPERIENTLGDNPFEDYIDRWVMYESKKASHSAPVVERPGLLRQILK